MRNEVGQRVQNTLVIVYKFRIAHVDLLSDTHSLSLCCLQKSKTNNSAVVNNYNTAQEHHRQIHSTQHSAVGANKSQQPPRPTLISAVFDFLETTRKKPGCS